MEFSFSLCFFFSDLEWISIVGNYIRTQKIHRKIAKKNIKKGVCVLEKEIEETKGDIFGSVEMW